MKLNLENINFSTNWATITAIVTLLIAAVTLYVQNTNLHSTNTELIEQNINLIKHVNGIDSTLLIMNQWMKFRDETIQELAKYPPSRIEKDMSRMEFNITKEIRLRHGMASPDMADFDNRNDNSNIALPTGNN